MLHQHLQPHEAQEEMREIFRRARDVPDMIQRLQKIKCRSCLQAVVNALKTYWHQQERLCHPLTGYYNISGQWLYAWHTIDQDLEILIHLTADQEQTTQQPPTNTTIQTTTKTTTTMSRFVNRHEGTIHHNEYHNCTINYGVEPTTTQLQSTANQNDLPSAPDLLCLDRHSISVIERKIKEAIEVPTKTKACANLYALQREGYINLDQYRSDEERAQALNRYQTTHIFCADDIQRGRSKR